MYLSIEQLSNSLCVKINGDFEWKKKWQFKDSILLTRISITCKKNSIVAICFDSKFKN